MYVLQDCPICYSEFDAQRKPHAISCGHVFCRPCIDTYASASSNCPICRRAFSPRDIHIITCTLQSDALNGNPPEPKQEKDLWKLLKKGLSDEYERRLLISNHPVEVLKQTKVSKKACTAVDIMRKLVQVEREKTRLEEQLRTARTLEERYSSQIATLEAQVGKVLKDKITKGSRQRSQELTSGPGEPSPRKTRSPHPAALRDSVFENSDNPKSPTLASKGSRRHSQVIEWMLAVPTTPRRKDNRSSDLPSVDETGGGGNATRSTDKRQGRSKYEEGISATGPTCAVATHSHRAQSTYELSLTVGERLNLSQGADLRHGDWIWCEKQDGKAGYAPSNYLRMLDVYANT